MRIISFVTIVASVDSLAVRFNCCHIQSYSIYALFIICHHYEVINIIMHYPYHFIGFLLYDLTVTFK